MWLPKSVIRKQIVAMWYLCHGRSAEENSWWTDLRISTIYDINHRLVDVITAHMEAANAAHRVGGDAVEREADEIALRCTVGVNSEGQRGV